VNVDRNNTTIRYTPKRINNGRQNQKGMQNFMLH